MESKRSDGENVPPSPTARLHIDPFQLMERKQVFR